MLIDERVGKKREREKGEKGAKIKLEFQNLNENIYIFCYSEKNIF